jgi:hypothetical protein
METVRHENGQTDPLRPTAESNADALDTPYRDIEALAEAFRKRGLLIADYVNSVTGRPPGGAPAVAN